MGSVLEEKMRNVGGGMLAPSIILEEMKLLKELQDQSGSRKVINSELWHACAGPLVCLPQVGSLAYYFPQGHSEQLAFSTKSMATSQIPNYPNLPAQLLCQVQNVTLHADKETDEIFTQMCLKPVNSEKDVFPVPDFGLKPSKHPNDFFCKILTASDTSTHGGFSVPRRAAEKLFPPLDFTMQPPTQELVVRDLHDNSWTFRHIYRGQPKRHLLTTGWSLFVGTKRLKAGDSVLFIRDEKSQLLVGVRRANRQQTTVTSVLSADSMHIGVLAAAAHATANRSPFTIFYNPRACPSEFVIPLAKFQKALYGTQFSVGMRFGMMFETEESSKRRYMGTIIGISDFDPLRWPGSKWRSLQVEWDEPGCCNKQNRVSIWEVETPESLFIFPSMTSSFKRPFHSGFLGAENEWQNMIKRPFIRVPEIGNMNSLAYPTPNLSSEQLVNMLLKPQFGGPAGSLSALQQASTANGGYTLEELKAMQAKSNQKTLPLCSEGMSLQNQNPSRLNTTPKCSSQTPVGINTDKAKLDPDLSTDQVSQLSSAVQNHEDKLSAGTASSPYNHAAFVNQNQGPAHVQTSSRSMQQASESLLYHAQQIDVAHSDFSGTNGSFPSLDNDECMFYQSLAGTMRSPGPMPVFGLQDSPSVLTEVNDFSLTSMGQEMWDNGLSNFRLLPHVNVDQLTSSHQDPSTLNCIPNSSSLRDLSDESNNQSGIYGCASLDVGTGASNVVDPSVSSTIMDEISTLKHADFQNHSHCNLVGNFSTSQDLQSQITSASLGDSQAFSRQELQDNSGGTSSSNIDLDENNLLQNSSWHPVVPPLRTYTKVQKTGSVGRSIDVTSYTNYEELCSAIECMFGLQGLLNDPRGSGWKLVYVDYENDVLLVGDDPWEEFVGCVRCIRILSPTEVQQMSEEGMKLLNSAAAMQGMNNSSVS